jgi:hypothetical protein
MAFKTKITANERPGVKKGDAPTPRKKDFGSATKYADFSKSTGIDGKGEVKKK